MCDRRCELMVNFTNWLTYRDRPVPDAKIATCPFKRLFKSTATSTNVQTGLSSFCDPPTPNTPERECWYINMGSVSRADFSTGPWWRTQAVAKRRTSASSEEAGRAQLRAARF